MLIYKGQPSKKERRVIKNILTENIDLFGDFYSTKENIRISLRDNPDELFDYLKKGSKMVYDPNKENGIALIIVEKKFRTYLKILTKDLTLANNFLKIINWYIKEDVYVKLHKNNSLIKIFQRNGYQFLGNRGMEILFMRKYIFRQERPIYKEGDEDND